MANGKVTLAELRKEAKRVGAGTVMVWHAKREFTLRWHAHAGVIAICGDTERDARRVLHKILRALPDGAMKEG
jgi:hypothetical protein